VSTWPWRDGYYGNRTPRALTIPFTIQSTYFVDHSQLSTSSTTHVAESAITNHTHNPERPSALPRCSWHSSWLSICQCPGIEMLSTCISCRLRLLGTVLLSVLCQNCLSYILHTRLGTQSYAPTVPRSELIQSTKVAGAIDRKIFWRCQKIRTKSSLTGRSRGFAGLSATTRASYVSPIEEAVGSLLGTDSSQDHQPSALIDAAASLTQESCRLLGTKSLGVDYGLARTGIAVTVGFEVGTHICNLRARVKHSRRIAHKLLASRNL
jgi:hypothetical protein